MHARAVKHKCRDCGGKRDRRAIRCNGCRMKSNDHPRLGTGKDWHVHEGTGYMVKCINGKWTYMHRWVMAGYLGRDLESDEHVHHIDGDKTNNDISNLRLMDAADHHREHMSSDVAKAMSALGHFARWGYVPNL